jgi:hypothetical protein
VEQVLQAFLRALRDLGWIEGQNLVIEYRWAEGKIERLPDLAAELVRQKVDLIVAPAASAAVAAKKATTSIPIVMMFPIDPVEQGLVASLSRPGGNVTGTTLATGSELFGTAPAQHGLCTLDLAAADVGRDPYAGFETHDDPTEGLLPRRRSGYSSGRPVSVARSRTNWSVIWPVTGRRRAFSKRSMAERVSVS